MKRKWPWLLYFRMLIGGAIMMVSAGIWPKYAVVYVFVFLLQTIVELMFII